MTYEKFEKIVNCMIKHNEKINKAYELKIDLFDAFDDQEIIIHELWNHVLTTEGADWFSWYLYEKDGISGKPRKDMQAWDHNKKEICKDLKGLWKYLTKNNYFTIQNK